MNLDELLAVSVTQEHKAQLKRAMRDTLQQWKEDAEEPSPVDDPTLPTCPHHGEYLDDEGGCCLCYEQTGDDFAYRGAGGVEERDV